MSVTYKKLWHLLIDRDTKKKDLEKMAGITHYQMYKLANNMTVTVDVIEAICRALNVTSNQIMDFIPNNIPEDVNIKNSPLGSMIDMISGKGILDSKPEDTNIKNNPDGGNIDKNSDGGNS